MKIAPPIHLRAAALAAPHNAVLPADTRRQIELFLTLALMICGLALFGGMATLLRNGLTPGALLMLALAGIMLGAYLLGRTLRYLIAIGVSVVSLNLAPFVYLGFKDWQSPAETLQTTEILGALAWLGPALILAGVLLPLRWLLALGGGAALLAATAPMVIAHGDISASLAALTMTVTLAALILTARLQAQRLESIRTRELSEHRDRLEERVRERTAHLERLNAELQDARQAAQAALQSRSQYLAEISYDLRAPLTIILGYSELLAYRAETQPDATLARSARALQTAARYLTALSQNLIDLAALERNQLQMQPQPVALAGLFDELCLLAQPLAARNHNRFESHMAAGPDTLHTDPLILSQVVINLLDNAAKFTHDGVIRLELSAQPSPAGQPGVLFTVADTGIGIAPAQIKALFQPFPPSHRATRQRYSGAGLGLAVAHRLCERLGGHILVESTLGQGSTFSVWLPAGGQETE